MKKGRCLRIYAFRILAVLGITGSAYGTGTVSGTVTNTSFQGVPNAVVMAYLNQELQDSTTTDTDGSYSIPGLAPSNEYELHVECNGYEYRIETDIAIVDSQTTTKNVTDLALEGKITGKVTLSDGTTAISGVIVNAKDSGGFTRMGYTNADGDYTIEKMRAGTYTVEALKTSYSFSDTEQAEVTPGQTTSGVNLTGVNGSIAGQITEFSGTTAIAGAFVIGKNGGGDVKARDITDFSGNYSLDGLPTGTYSLQVLRSDGSRIATVTNVSVTDGQTTTRNVSAGGGSISGTVETSSESPLAGVIVVATKGEDRYSGLTNASGNYKIEALAVGTYDLTVDPNENDYVAAKIDDVSVIAGQETSGQDFSLGTAGKITGTVTNTSQEAIAGAFVTAAEGAGTSGVWFTSTQTDQNGSYTINHLRTGTYTVYVQADGYVSDSETSACVTAGQTTSGKDFSLGTSGGSISGTVYESDGETPIEGAMVQCSCEGKSWRYALSDGNGDYSLTLLQAGSYRLMASAEGYDAEILTDVVVTGTSENSGNDFTLEAAE